MRQRSERRVANDKTEERTADRRQTDIKRARKDGLGCIERGRYVIGLCLTVVTRPIDVGNRLDTGERRLNGVRSGMSVDVGNRLDARERNG